MSGGVGKVAGTALQLAPLLGFLPGVGPILAASPQFVPLFEGLVDLLEPGDQETAREAYRDLIADNDEGFARLDAKLEAAKNR